MNTINRKSVDATGYLASNWVGLNDETPALIMNPKATPLDMLAWCWAETESLRSTLLALSSSSSSLEPGELSAILLHRIGPLANVMDVAVSELVAQQMQHANGAEQACIIPGTGADTQQALIDAENYYLTCKRIHDDALSSLQVAKQHAGKSGGAA